jgi:DNA-binding MarR family transcriptional regulator
MTSFNLDDWIVYRLWRISQEAGFELEAWYKKAFGLSATEWHSIAILANHAPLSAKDLAGMLDITQVQMTRTISRLLGEDLVYRHTDDADRRRVVLGLSKKGSRLYDKLAPKAAAIEQKMLSVFTPQERAQFFALFSCLERPFKP